MVPRGNNPSSSDFGGPIDGTYRTVNEINKVMPWNW